MSQHKNRGNSRETLYTVVVGEMAFNYDNFYISSKGSEAYILTRQMHAVLHLYQNLGQVSLSGIILHCHIMLIGLLHSM